MSGICAILQRGDREVDSVVLQRMIQVVAHRGPDGAKVWRQGSVGLGHLALHATPEATREGQPLWGPGDRAILVADARLDDRTRLIDELELRVGPEADGPTDAELILEAYDRWGIDAPRFLTGDFAFVIWDGANGRLFAARDQLGLKPLHFAITPEAICLASEAQQILQHPSIPQRLDLISLSRRLLGRIDPDRTSFENVNWLPPAHTLVWSDGNLQIEKYWCAEEVEPLTAADPEEYLERFRGLASIAVGDRLRTQAKSVGLLLSGGLDSTSLAALGRSIIPSGESPRILGLSALFAGMKDTDEREFIQESAAHFDLEVRYFQALDYPLLRDGDEYQPDLESPIQGWPPLESAMLEWLHREEGRVVFTGHGGDSVFSGSPLLYADLFRQVRWRELARDLGRHARYKKVSPLLLAYLYLFKPLAPAGLTRLVRWVRKGRPGLEIPPWIRPEFARRTGLREFLDSTERSVTARGSGASQHRFEATHLGDVRGGLYWHDRIAARFGIEARHPFLDRRLIEFALAIPLEEHYRAGQGKLLLRRALGDLLPPQVRQRKGKAIFRPFVRAALVDQEFHRVRSLLGPDCRLGELGAIDIGILQRALEELRQSGSSSLEPALWSLIGLEQWLRRHW